MTYTPIVPGSLNWDVPVNAQFTNDNTRLDGIDTSISFINFAIGAQSAQIAALQTNVPSAPSQGLVSWSYDPVMANAGQVIATGSLHFSKVLVMTSTNITSVIYNVSTIGTTLTAGQNFVAVYDSAGNRVAVSADQTTNFGVLGTKTATFASTPLSSGTYYIGFLANGSVAPAIRGVVNTDTMLNAGTTTSTPRFARFGAGLTTTPTGFSLPASTYTSYALWGAVD